MAEFNREEIDYEDQLRQSERERKDLKNIIYELPVGLITVKGGNELTIDIANHEFCRMSGYELADFSMEMPITPSRTLHPYLQSFNRLTP